MPCYKENSKKTWYCSFYYKDWTGENKRKLKRGFKTKKDAQEFERKFIESLSKQSDITFQSLYNNYISDMKIKLKQSSITSKEVIFLHYIVPFFKDYKINEITSSHISQWQNYLITTKTKKDTPLSNSYMRKIHKQMSAIMNYSIKHYGLNKNPCSITGNIKKKNKEMKIWSLEEYNKFKNTFTNKQHILMFDLLFFTGIRKGELLALTFEDFKDNKILKIDKTFYRHKNKDYITEPKTEGSKRDVVLPNFLYDEFLDYKNSCYGLDGKCRIFEFSSNTINRLLNRHIKIANLEQIRVHDLRHSHASLLIDMKEFSIIEISKRLGHDTPQTTLNTYAHLYPNKQHDLANKLNDLVEIVSK